MERVAFLLDDLYGPEVWDGPRDPLDVLVRAILSQNTNGENSERAYAGLRRRFRTWEGVARARVEEVAEAIRPGGLSNQKARTIQGLLVWLKRERGELRMDFLGDMDPQEALRLLGGLRGIGVKTVYVTLMFACGKEVFPVDTHIHRIAGRLGWIPESCSPARAHDLLAPVVPKGRGLSLHVNLLEFGRRICRARNPACSGCPLRSECLWIGRQTAGVGPGAKASFSSGPPPPG